VKIVTISGVGIGSSGVLKVNTERALSRIGIDADVTAADASTLATVAADAQLILTSPDFVDAIGKTAAEVVVVENASDTKELASRLKAALGS
jgi:ascorbate PTS system EIIB component